MFFLTFIIFKDYLKEDKVINYYHLWVKIVIFYGCKYTPQNIYIWEELRVNLEYKSPEN